MRTGILLLAFFVLPACDAVTTATAEDDKNTPPTDCWFEDVATNGAENLAYPSPSQSAGNTFYGCYGTDSSGTPKGVWIAFYTNGTSYWGGVTVIPSKNATTCRLTWHDGTTEHGYATGATLNSAGEIQTIDVVSASMSPETLHLTCSINN